VVGASGEQVRPLGRSAGKGALAPASTVRIAKPGGMRSDGLVAVAHPESELSIDLDQSIQIFALSSATR